MACSPTVVINWTNKLNSGYSAYYLYADCNLNQVTNQLVGNEGKVSINNYSVQLGIFIYTNDSQGNTISYQKWKPVGGGLSINVIFSGNGVITGVPTEETRAPSASNNEAMLWWIIILLIVILILIIYSLVRK